MVRPDLAARGRGAPEPTRAARRSGYLRGPVPDPRPLIHRRRRNVVLGAFAAFAIGAAVGAGSGGGGDGGDRRPAEPNALVPPASAPPDPGESPVDGLTLRQQVGQLIVLRFAGTTPPGYVREALRERRAAGAILFRDNVTSPAQLRALTRRLRRAGGRPVVAVDQEGGEIRIVPWAPPAASAPAQAADGRVRADARAAGPALRAARDHGHARAGRGRAHRRRRRARRPRVLPDPHAAAAAMAGAVAGWRAAGVAATAKHFPGLGGAKVNTDDGPATVTRSRAELEATDLPPFAAAIDAGVPLVMIGHARYPALDPDRIASQSAPIIERPAARRARLPRRRRHRLDGGAAPRSPPAASPRCPSAPCAPAPTSCC